MLPVMAMATDIPVGIMVTVIEMQISGTNQFIGVMAMATEGRTTATAMTI